MNNVFVNLFLKRFNDDGLYSLEDVLKKVKCVIILGMPGSGKSTLLKHFEETNHAKTEYFPIRDFGNISITLSPSTQYLLLDGLDEFRNTNTDKISALTKIANQIQQIDRENLHIAISCREMDWFGDTDADSLRRYLKTEATIFYVQPLNNEQKKSLAEQLLLPDNFMRSFNQSGFLDNPQLFTMLAKLYKEDANISLESKAGLYQKFVEFAKEQNPVNKYNGINCIETDEFFKDAGYIAFYYMFARASSIDETLLEKISSQGKGYLQDRLEIVIKSALFSEGQFTHRTIAEYLCAYFLYHQKIQQEQWSIGRIKALLAPQGIVFTELRGVYSWLCAFSQDESLFEIDPYLQYQYGDNSLFSIENKQAVISAVKKYSEKDPHFYRKGFLTAPKAFYEKGLDDFLIEEYKTSWDNYSHYLFFLSDLLSHSSSAAVKELAESVLMKEDLPYYYKTPFLVLVKQDIDFLNDLLKQILDKKIQDPENDLIDGILNFLYPDHIGPDKILGYINAYQKEESFRRRCVFLLKTPQTKQYNLIKSIFLEYRDGNHNVVTDIPYYFEKFICDYFYRITCQESPKRFWDLIMEFYTLSNNQDILARFFEKRQILKEIGQGRKNLLYGAYWAFAVSHYTEENGFLKTEYALSFVAEKLRPNDPVPFIEKHLKETNSSNLNIELIIRIYQELKSRSDMRAKNHAEELAKKYGLLERFQKWISPPPIESGPKPEWKRREETNRIKTQERVEKNETFVASLSDEEKENNFNLLARCAFFAYMKDIYGNQTGLTAATFESLKKIIKDKLISKAEDRFQRENLTIESIAANAKKAHRNIDIFYYVAGALNSATEYDQLKDDDFFEYLYIVSALNEIIGNVQKTDFCKWLEQKNIDRSIEILKRYALLLLKEEKFSQEVERGFQGLILSSEQSDKQKEVRRLKQMVQLTGPSDAESAKAAFLHNLFVSYHVHIPIVILNSLSDLNEKNEYERQLLLRFANREKEKIGIKETLGLFGLLPGYYNGYDGILLNELNFKDRLFLVDCLISNFNTPELLTFHSGFQSQQAMCAAFVNNDMWNLIRGDEGMRMLETLLSTHRRDDYWTNRILSRIRELQEKDADEHRQSLSIEKAKNYILKDSYTSSEDFFADVKDKLIKIQQDVKDDSNHEKNPFYGSNGESKQENDCRDVILNKWNDRYSLLAVASREKMEADNRVDMNIRCENSERYEVQIECKKDKNPGLKTGIPNQLVKKYLNSQVQYGIYLVFCFEEKTNIQAMKDVLYETIPEEYKGKIEVFCMDLRKSRTQR